MTPPRGRVALVADGLNVHHRRFLAALTDAGWDARVVPYAPADGLGPALAAAAPDVVLAGPVPDVGAAAVATAPTGVPVVLTAWGSDLLVTVAADADAAARARVALSAAAAVVVDCRTVEAAAVALGADPRGVVRFPWGVDLAAHPFLPAPAPAAALRVVSLRSLVPAYLVGTLVRAAARVPDLTVTLAGGGPDEADLRRLAEDLGIPDRVASVGRLDEAGVPALLAAHDVVVSTAPSDGASVSLLQAMAVGRPCVVVDNPSNREWVEDGVTGWLVPAGDDAVLADVLRRLADPATAPLRARVATAARAVVERHADWGRNRALLVGALERAVAS